MAASAADITWQIKAAVIAKIQALGLVSDDGKSDLQAVLGQMVPDESNNKWPAVIVTELGMTEEQAESTTEGNQYWIPVYVFIGDRVSERNSSKESLYLWWRSLIREAFQHNPLAAVPAARGCEVRFVPIFDPRLKEYQYLVCGLVLRFYVALRRTRSS